MSQPERSVIPFVPKWFVAEHSRLHDQQLDIKDIEDIFTELNVIQDILGQALKRTRPISRGAVEYYETRVGILEKSTQSLPTAFAIQKASLARRIHVLRAVIFSLKKRFAR